MREVVVEAPMGVTLRGPVTLRLSKAQHAPRAHVLGKARRDGVYLLDGGREVMFKRGEVFAIEASRLGPGLADLTPPEAVPAGDGGAAGGTGAEAGAGAGAAAEAGTEPAAGTLV